VGIDLTGKGVTLHAEESSTGQGIDIHHAFHEQDLACYDRTQMHYSSYASSIQWAARQAPGFVQAAVAAPKTIQATSKCNQAIVAMLLAQRRRFGMQA
jgi:hypothetical protein